MRVRNGFVSNSSSTCFILDLRDENVKDLLSKVETGPPHGLCRNTCKAIGRDAVSYLQDLAKVQGKWNDEHEWEIVRKLNHWITKLGEDNIVFLRESDEQDDDLFGDDEDYWPDKSQNQKLLYQLALDTFEYH